MDCGRGVSACDACLPCGVSPAKRARHRVPCYLHKRMQVHVDSAAGEPTAKPADCLEALWPCTVYIRRKVGGLSQDCTKLRQTDAFFHTFGPTPKISYQSLKKFV